MCPVELFIIYYIYLLFIYLFTCSLVVVFFVFFSFSSPYLQFFNIRSVLTNHTTQTLLFSSLILTRAIVGSRGLKSAVKCSSALVLICFHAAGQLERSNLLLLRNCIKDFFFPPGPPRPLHTSSGPWQTERLVY